MVSPVTYICNKMTSRCSMDRSRLDIIREMADEMMSRSHEFLARSHPRPQQSLYTVRLGRKWTSRRARAFSVVMYFMCVTAFALVLGFFYLNMWHPNTDAIFRRNRTCDT